jgi:hypothetical protein
MPTPDTLDMRIRSMVAELIEQAPEAPTLPELDRPDPAVERGEAGRRHRPRRRLRLVALTGGVVGAVLVTALVLLLLPAVAQRQPLAAAAELRLIASNAAGQSTPALGPGQWLSARQRVSFFAQVTQVGATPTPEAEATVKADITQWTDGKGDACISATSGPAQFASAANQSAWTAAGLVDDPAGQPSVSCVTGGGTSTSNSLVAGPAVIDASSLPTDPSTLATELINGTTGNTSLDNLPPGVGGNPGFARAVLLLVGPTSGVTPAFSAALYDALSMIPGMDMLGSMTTHEGAVGLGFAGGPGSSGTVIIVDPATGSLLEVQDIQSPLAFGGLGPSYLAPAAPPGTAPTPGIGTEGGSYGATIEWLDPVGTPTVVGADSLPPGACYTRCGP